MLVRLLSGSTVALLRPAGALYTTHMRNEGGAVLDSLEESFAAGRAAGVPVVISVGAGPPEARRVRQEAGIAVAMGLSHASAIKAIIASRALYELDLYTEDAVGMLQVGDVSSAVLAASS